MSSQATLATARAGAHLGAPQKSIERQLGRFPPELAAPVRALAARHERLAQLSLSFPALLGALAWPRRGIDARSLIAGVIAGTPLASLAEQAGVPTWLRRVPTEMLPAPIPALPDSAFFRHRISNHIPSSPKLAARWFANLSFAARWADEFFALWCAQMFAKPLKVRRRHGCDMGLLCLWAWYSGRPNTLGRSLMARPWTPEIEFEAATGAALAWRESLDLRLHLGDRTLCDIWHAPGSVDGYEFLPLRSANEIEDEARAMENCLRTYGELVAHGGSRIWAVRKEGARVATMEIGRRRNDPVPAIQQICRIRNAEPLPEVWIAAHRWLRAQDMHVCSGPAPDWGAVRPDRHVWQDLWKPYWLAKKRIPDWLPLVASHDTLFDI